MSVIGEQDHRFTGWPLAVKHFWVEGRPGIQAVAAAAESVQKMGTTLGGITTATGDAMRTLQVSWAGPASDAARTSSDRTSHGAQETQRLADNGAAQILEYGNSFEAMRHKIVFEDPRKLDVSGWATELVKVGWDQAPWVAVEDQTSILARNARHDQAANDALLAHQQNAARFDDAFVTTGADPRSPSGAVGSVTVGDGASGAGTGSVSVASHVGSAAGVPSTGASAVPPPVVASPPVASSSGPGIPGVAALPPVPDGAGSTSSPAGAGSTSSPAGAGSTSSTATGGSRSGGAGAGAVPGAGAGAGAVPGAGGSSGAAGVPGTYGGGSSTVGPAASTGTVPDPAQARARLGEQFGRDLAAGSPGARPGTGGALGSGSFGSGVPAPVGAPGVRAGTGSSAGGWGAAGSPYHRGLVPGGTGAGSGAGGGWRGGLGEPGPRPPGETGSRPWARSMPGEGPLARPGTGEPGVTGRPATGYGSGFAPMMGGLGGARSGGDEHRNRFLLPSSEPFDVDLPHAPPVIGPDEEDRE